MASNASELLRVDLGPFETRWEKEKWRCGHSPIQVYGTYAPLSLCIGLPSPSLVVS